MAGQLAVVVGNILGGIAAQTAVLVVVLEVAGVRPCAPLRTRLAASLLLVLEGALVIAVLGVVVMGTRLSGDLSFARLSPAADTGQAGAACFASAASGERRPFSTVRSCSQLTSGWAAGIASTSADR
ncbi:hypothetical protein QWJ26_26350 [Streptomyces sp. CSDS2]|uniref:hypothetical protein n=1 Tax=Streptomyces sp. CSDS2 TaxID=3055051 RepID=UPI0025B0DD72|nr:hypothetical protein [Streptomyces sp. CSDS2]MDN3263267.1 hypothetical protein [Streptomyces sp. CSDS2]